MRRKECLICVGLPVKCREKQNFPLSSHHSPVSHKLCENLHIAFQVPIRHKLIQAVPVKVEISANTQRLHIPLASCNGNLKWKNQGFHNNSHKGLRVQKLIPLDGQGLQQPGLVKSVPAHDRGFGTRCSLKSLPTQTILWFWYIQIYTHENRL